MALGNPAPFGLICFGMTTLTLMYVEMGWCEADFEVQIAGLAMALGGFGQILVAIFEIIKGSSFSFCVFGCYGAFWVTWSIIYIQKSNKNSTFGDATYSDGTTLYLAQWGILTFCFWVVTWRKNIALITIFFLLTTTFFLLAAATKTESAETRKAGGYFGFLTAVAAFYTGVAELVNEEYGRHILPGIKPLLAPQRLQITAHTINSLMHYDAKSNTLLLQFRGLQIKTEQDVRVIEECVEAAIKDADPPEGKVHVVADYEGTYISQDVLRHFWKMAEETERKYYLSVTRFHVSSFGTWHYNDSHGVAAKKATRSSASDIEKGACNA